MNNSSQLLLFYQFISFFQSLFSNLTDTGSFIPNTVIRNTNWFAMIVTYQLTSKENAIIYGIHVVMKFTAVSRLVKNKKVYIHARTEKISVKTLTHKEPSWL